MTFSLLRLVQKILTVSIWMVKFPYSILLMFYCIVLPVVCWYSSLVSFQVLQFLHSCVSCLCDSLPRCFAPVSHCLSSLRLFSLSVYFPLCQFVLFLFDSSLAIPWDFSYLSSVSSITFLFFADLACSLLIWYFRLCVWPLVYQP